MAHVRCVASTRVLSPALGYRKFGGDRGIDPCADIADAASPVVAVAVRSCLLIGENIVLTD